MKRALVIGANEEAVFSIRTAQRHGLWVDAMDCNEIVGSIAGDDTIMCAVRTVEDTAALMQRLRALQRE